MELKTYFAQDSAGNLTPGATVTIYEHGTTNIVSGITKADGTALSNPFNADTSGRIQFRAPDGYYDMRVNVGSGVAQVLTIQCVDYSDAKANADRAETAADRAEASASKLASSIVPCSIPTISNGVKAIMKDDSSNDFYIISKRANGKSGYISSRITNSATGADESNYGGSSPFRPGSVSRVRNAIYAKLVPSAKSSGVTLSTFTTNQINTLYGFSPTDTSISAKLSIGDFSLSSPRVYILPNGESVTYQLTTKSKAKVRLGCSYGASSSVSISISRDGVNWSQPATINCKLPPSGQAPLPIDVDVNGLPGTWFIKISNGHTNPAYLVGLNVMDIGGSEIYDYDNFIATTEPDLTGGPSYYFAGLGATEFAAKELSTGKFFGTYHGGHSDFLQRLRTESASLNLDTGSAPTLLLSRNVTLHSSSTITVGESTYNYVSSTQFGDGVHITNYTLEKKTGEYVLCERIYTHMATTGRNFDWVHFPKLIHKTDDGDFLLGQTGFIQQFRSEDTATVNCYFSQVNIDDNGYNGAYISFQPNYNKQYYGPAFSSVTGHRLFDGSYTTCKEFF